MRTTWLVLAIAVSLPPVCARTTAASAIGDLDPTFGDAGAVETVFPVTVALRAVLVRGDDRLVAVGHRRTGTSFQPSGHAMAGYLADGSPDATFGSGGTAEVPTPGGRSDASVVAAALQADGRIVVVGMTGLGPMLVRYSATGVPDATFASGAGAAFVGFGTTVSMLRQADGGLLLAVLEAAAFDGSLRLVRFLPDGDLDTTFGVGGVGPAVALSGIATQVDAMTAHPDGRVVVSGTAGGTAWIVQFLADGAPDTTFGASGVVPVTSAALGFPPGCSLSGISDVAVDASGRIVFGSKAGCSDLGGAVAAVSPVSTGVIARYSAAGVLDTAFGNDGAAGPAHLLPAGVWSTLRVLPRTDGSVLLAGGRGELIGVTPAGAPDVRLAVGGHDERYLMGTPGLALQSDGRMVQGGTTSLTRFRLLRRETTCSGPDTDGDGIDDGCDPCVGGVATDRLTMTVSKLRVPYANDKLSVSARATFPVPPAIDPTVTDVRALLEDAAGGVVVDGPYVRGFTFGWSVRTTPKSTTYRYSNKVVSTGQASVVVVTVETTGRVSVKLKMRSAAFRTDPARLPAKFSFVLTAPWATAGQCLTADLTPPGACAFSVTGAQLKCRR